MARPMHSRATIRPADQLDQPSAGGQRRAAAQAAQAQASSRWSLGDLLARASAEPHPNALQAPITRRTGRQRRRRHQSREHRTRARSADRVCHLVALPRRPAWHHGAQHLHGRRSRHLRRGHPPHHAAMPTSASWSTASWRISSVICATPSKAIRAGKPCKAQSVSNSGRVYLFFAHASGRLT